MRYYCEWNSNSNSNQENGFDHFHNYYKDLGSNLSKDKFHEITMSEIRQAYTKLVKEYHPDTNPDIPNIESAEKLEKIKKAYSILGNASLKQQYDNYHRSVYRDIPFHSMRRVLEKEAEMEHKNKYKPETRSFHQKLNDKTYQFNYYADKHKKGGLRTNRVQYDANPFTASSMNNTKNNNDNNENNMKMDDDNAGNNNQQSFKPKHIKYFMILGPLLALAIIDAFDLYPKSNRLNLMENLMKQIRHLLHG